MIQDEDHYSDLFSSGSEEESQIHILSVNRIQSASSVLFIVKMLVDGKEMKVTIDTAATRSVVSKDVVSATMVRPCNINLLAANDGKLNIIGKCFLTLSDGNAQWRHEFLVHDQKSEALQILIGTDFHDMYKTRTCFEDNTFSIPTQNSRVIFDRVDAEEEDQDANIFTIMNDLAQNEGDLYSAHNTL